MFSEDTRGEKNTMTQLQFSDWRSSWLRAEPIQSDSADPSLWRCSATRRFRLRPEKEDVNLLI